MSANEETTINDETTDGTRALGWVVLVLVGAVCLVVGWFWGSMAEVQRYIGPLR